MDYIWKISLAICLAVYILFPTFIAYLLQFMWEYSMWVICFVVLFSWLLGDYALYNIEDVRCYFNRLEKFQGSTLFPSCFGFRIFWGIDNFYIGAVAGVLTNFTSNIDVACDTKTRVNEVIPTVKKWKCRQLKSLAICQVRNVICYRNTTAFIVMSANALPSRRYCFLKLDLQARTLSRFYQDVQVESDKYVEMAISGDYILICSPNDRCLIYSITTNRVMDIQMKIPIVTPSVTRIFGLRCGLFLIQDHQVGTVIIFNANTTQHGVIFETALRLSNWKLSPYHDFIIANDFAENRHGAGFGDGTTYAFHWNGDENHIFSVHVSMFTMPNMSSSSPSPHLIGIDMDMNVTHIKLHEDLYIYQQNITDVENLRCWKLSCDISLRYLPTVFILNSKLIQIHNNNRGTTHFEKCFDTALRTQLAKIKSGPPDGTMVFPQQDGSFFTTRLSFGNYHRDELLGNISEIGSDFRLSAKYQHSHTIRLFSDNFDKIGNDFIIRGHYPFCRSLNIESTRLDVDDVLPRTILLFPFQFPFSIIKMIIMFTL